MPGGPFTRDDQWQHAGIVDPFECKRILMCMRSPQFRRELAKFMPTIIEGYGDPNGVVEACRSTTYYDITVPTAPVEWYKTTSTGKTGWI